MRRSEKEMTEGEVCEFLRTMNAGVLCFSDNSEAYGVPVHFVYDADRRAIYFHGAREGRKAGLISSGSRVCFTVFEQQGLKSNELPCKIGTHYRSVIAKGFIGEVTDPQEKQQALSAMVRSLSENRQPISDEGSQKTLVSRLDISELSGKRDTKK